MPASELFSTALRYLLSLLETAEAEDFLRTAQPEDLRRDLMLYRQDLRMIIRRLTHDDLSAIDAAFPERSAEILALIGDVGVEIESRDDAARLGVAMVRLGGVLSQSAELVGVTLPSTVFVARIGRPVAPPPDQPQRRPKAAFRRIKNSLLNVVAPIVFMYGALRGKPLAFDAPDSFEEPDLYPSGEPFGRRVFISYERSSRPLAEKFDAALRSEGFEPYRYEPGKAALSAMEKYGIAEFRAAYPGVGEEIVRTVRRSSAALFILSEAATRSPLCQLEAFATVITFFPFSSGIYVVVETPRVRVPELLLRGVVRQYEPGLEKIVARDIEQEIEQLANFRETAEVRRLERGKKRAPKMSRLTRRRKTS